ncbi:MAG: aspartate kinase [Myxococcales bacterium]|nr:MAG: aspartate kinase [Myxococcales bacterium]
MVVQKYGGSSVADLDKIRGVARRIVRVKEEGYHIVAVVSAMGSSTDNLLSQAYQVSPAPPKRELDMLLSVGERISASLLTMALHELGHEAISFTGSQCGIITSDNHANARIIDVRPVRILDELARDKIVIVAGFQGMSYKREVTTLGRGGSDTTAIALAAALGATWCEICSDVDGVYTADPRLVPEAEKIESLSYDEMEEMGEAGAKVLNPDAIEFARRMGLKVMLTSTFKEGGGTVLLARDKAASGVAVKAVATRRKIYLVELSDIDPKETNEAVALFDELKAPVESLALRVGERATARIRLAPERVPDWALLERRIGEVFGESARIDATEGSASLIGPGLGDEVAYLRQAEQTLRRQGVAFHEIELSRNRLTFFMSAEQVDSATTALHAAFFGRPPSA